MHNKLLIRICFNQTETKSSASFSMPVFSVLAVNASHDECFGPIEKTRI